ncbi:MAG: amidohydrolase [Mycobacterium sp.]
MQLDLVVENARVATMDDEHPWAESFGVLNGRICALGSASTLPAKRRLNLQNRLVLPGFADAHNHMTWYGLMHFEIDLTACQSLEDLYALIREHCEANPSDEVIIGNGYLHTEIGGVHPDRAVLDKVADGRPVWLRHGSGHMCAVNTPVLEALNLLQRIPAGIEHYVEVDDEGVPTGVLTETAQTLVVDHFTPYRLDYLTEAIATAAQKYVAQGLTSVTEAGIGGGWMSKSPIELAAYQRLLRDGRLPVRVELMPTADALHALPSHPDDDMRFGLDLGISNGFGNDRLRIGPMKIWLDGGLASRTARVGESYHDVHACGFYQNDPEEMRSTVRQAVASGWQVAMHVIGDEAIDYALTMFEELAKEFPVEQMRHRFEHAGMTQLSDLPRMRALGITPIIQPGFLWSLGETMYRAVGADRADMLYRARSFIDAGIRLVSSSDRPVADGDPLKGIEMALYRRTPRGRVIGPNETIGILDAIKSYTVNPAWVSKAEGDRGMLADGYYADFVVLSSNIIDEPASVTSAKVVSTFVEGDCVYER